MNCSKRGAIPNIHPCNVYPIAITLLSLLSVHQCSEHSYLNLCSELIHGRYLPLDNDNLEMVSHTVRLNFVAQILMEQFCNLERLLVFSFTARPLPISAKVPVWKYLSEI